MSKLPGIQATLDLLERLRQTVHQFASLEDAARKSFHSRAAGEAKAVHAAAQARSVQLAEGLASLDSDLNAEEARARQHFEARQRRIAAAYKSCRKRTLDMIEAQESKHRYTLQKRLLDAERVREAALVQAGERLQQFRQRLAQSQERFAQLEGAARQAFSGVGEFNKLLAPDRAWPPNAAAGDEDQMLEGLGRVADDTDGAIQRFRRTVLGSVLRVCPVWLFLTLAVLTYGAAIFALPRYAAINVPLRSATLSLAGAVVLIVAVYGLAKRLRRPSAISIARNLDQGRTWHDAAWHKAETRERDDKQSAQTRAEETTRRLNEDWERAREEVEQLRLSLPQQLDAKQKRAAARNNRLLDRAVEQVQRSHAQLTARVQEEARTLEDRTTRESRGRLDVSETAFQGALIDLEAQWQSRIQPIWDEVVQLNRSSAELTLSWDDPAWQDWAVRSVFPEAVPFGHIDVDVEQLAGIRFDQRRLRFPGPVRFSLPLLLHYPEQGSLLIETNSADGDEAVGALNAAVFRLLALAPPGQVSLTLFDPAGLGQNFASLMHLADFEDNQIDSRIWTQASQFEEKLAELNEHMEKVIQMYLRNEYPSLAEFNAHAGTLAEKYHFLVIAGFPLNFSETAGRRLLNIAVSGARCGVYILMHWDRRRDLPHDFVADDLLQHSVRVAAEPRGWAIPGLPGVGVKLELDRPPAPQWATDFLRRVGERTRAAGRVELDFREVAPTPAQRWTRDATDEFRIPIGRSGATKPQELALGKGTRQHALISGKTGSGKSTLFHVIITNTALTYSPEEVEFYLVDFKKGVEFKCYATRQLPHARVIAIESDREFGLSVLQRVDEELRRRGEAFRKAGVQDLPGYRRTAGCPALPRVLLMIDEFQEFFTEEDRVSQGAAVLLDRIVRQGRAFGIHVVLGSQTLGGAYTLARATIGQMVVRIALQCNEADAYLIMDENNPAPRLLSRPGEGIYNDMAGAIEANSPFQVAWLPDEVRDRALAEVQLETSKRWATRPQPFIFEGNAPADPDENEELTTALGAKPVQPPMSPRVWLGAPNAIKGPTAAVFERQSGANLLVVGQGEPAVLGIPALALISLGAQYPVGTARLILIDSAPPGSAERSFFDRLVERLPFPVVRPKRHDVPDLVRSLAAEVAERTGDEPLAGAPATFIVITNLQEIKALRQEDDFSLETSDTPSAATAFASVLTDGPGRGVHVIATVDSYGNVSRYLARKLLGQFQWRLLFQMSASDSASLIDEPEASRLGFHKALLYNEREGYIEKFRPYAVLENLDQLLPPG